MKPANSVVQNLSREIMERVRNGQMKMGETKHASLLLAFLFATQSNPMLTPVFPD